MKRLFIRNLTAALLVLVLLLTPVAAFAVGDTVYTNSRWLADNLEYVNTIRWCTTYGRTESFAIRMTGPGDAYPIIMNGDTVFGAFRISRMVSYAESLGLNVLAVVNTDFFSMQTGVPLGIVIEDGVYKSSPSDRIAVCFGGDGSVFLVEDPTVQISLLINERGEAMSGEAAEEGAAGGETDMDAVRNVVNLNNFNKFRVDVGGLYLFSEAFSTVSTRTSTPGWFVRFRVIEGTPTVSGTMTLEVTELLESDGAIPIGEGYMVLSAASAGGYDATFEMFEVGDIVTMVTTASDERLADAQYATGAGDVLVRDGVKTDQTDWDRALLSRAPRTAFGVRADGTVVSYVVDGRNSTHSVGLTLDELADEMLRQGSVFAVNFDGGGSSALSVRMPGDRSASVVSRPSEGSERACATYIVFVTDAEPGGESRNLSLVNDGEIVLAGSTVELKFAATDRAYMPVAAPDDIYALSSAIGASIDGTTYTAGDVAMTDRLTLRSPSTGAVGTGEIFVITRPTSVIPTRRGSTAQLNSVRLLPGERLELGVTATYYRRDVVSQLHLFEFEVSGDIGHMTDEPGVFIAGQAMQQTGSITVSAGGRSAEIRVDVGGFLDMEGHWAREYAEYLAMLGIVTGVTSTEYVPNELMIRGDFCLMLYRSAGLPAFTSTGTFDDIPEGIYYAEAVEWARAMGIAEAVEGNSFHPAVPLTRQDAFTFIYRTLELLGKEFKDGVPDDLVGFPDAGALSDYAVIPAATLVRLGIVEGSDGLLEPLSGFTRGQMAKLVASVLQL